MRMHKLSALPLILLFLGFSAEAAKWPLKKEELLRRKQGLMSKVNHKRLERALSYARHEKYDDATKVLIELIKQTEKRKDEYAQMWQHLGFMLAQKGDLPKGIKALENSLEANALPYQPSLASLYTLGQLYLATEKYKEAHGTLELWFTLAEDPQPEAYILMATALSQVDQKEEALKYVNQAIISTPDPQEKWLQFALALNHELKHFGNALKILATLTAKFPKNDKYWRQFAGTYLSLNQDAKALSTLELAHKLGHVKAEADLLNMASLYVYLDLPYKGARFLNNEIKAGRVSRSQKTLELLSQAWMAAREKNRGFEALGEAASLAEKGDLFARKGFLLLEDERWGEALQAFSSALKKGGVTYLEKIYFAMGLAQYNLKDLITALEYLQKAKKLDEDDKSIERWIEQVKNELYNRLVGKI